MAEDRLECSWCQNQNPTGATSCTRCGAPLSVEDLVTEAGWRSAPKVRDTTSFAFGSSTCEVEGEVVPSVAITLAAGDWIYFEASALLWKDDALRWNDDGHKRGGTGLYRSHRDPLMTADGPGRIALARESAGELVVLPVDPGHEIVVKQQSFIAASHSVEYTISKDTGMGWRTEHFKSKGDPGLLMLHGAGNVFQKTLSESDTIRVEPGSVLYKDASVKVQSVKIDSFKAGAMSGHPTMLKLTGPGRVGIQSMDPHHQQL